MTDPPLAVPTRRAVLRAFLVSVLVSALVGVGVVIAGDSSDFVVKTFVSSLAVSGASLLALCGAAQFEATGDRFPAVPTIAAAALALLLTLLGIWGGVKDGDFWNLLATAWITGAVGAHTALLGLARLARRHLFVAGWTDLVVYLLGLTATIMIWGDVHSEVGVRTLGVLSILAAAGTLAVPVLHRMNRATSRLRSRPIRARPCRCSAPHVGRATRRPSAAWSAGAAARRSASSSCARRVRNDERPRSGSPGRGRSHHAASTAALTGT